MNQPPFPEEGTTTAEAPPAEVLTPSVAEVQSRVEIDTAIATARRYPRSPTQFLHRAISLATLTPEIAAKCEYAKPVGGDRVNGPSVRLAEIVAATYGNIRVQARVISETHSEVIAQGVAHDLETNVAQSTEVRVSLLKKDRKTRVGPEQVSTAHASACAKARRNAIFLVVPLAIVQPVIEKAREVAAGTAATLPERREAMLAWFEQRGVKRSQILEWLNVQAVGDIGLDQMADLLAAQNTAKEEGVDLGEIFGRRQEASRFSDDAPALSNAKEALEKAKAAAAQAEKANAVPSIDKLRADCLALAKKVSDEVLAAILDTFSSHTVAGVADDQLAALHAALTAAKKK